MPQHLQAAKGEAVDARRPQQRALGLAAHDATAALLLQPLSQQLQGPVKSQQQMKMRLPGQQSQERLLLLLCQHCQLSQRMRHCREQQR